LPAEASTALILCCISLDMLLSHSLPALVWLSLPPCISATVWTKLWNTEFYWYRVLTCGEHPRSLEIPDCTQRASKLLHKFYHRTSPLTGNSRLYATCFQITTQVLSQKHFVTQNTLFTPISFHLLHLSLFFSPLSYHTLGDLAGSFRWRINSTSHKLFSIHLYGASSFAGSTWFIPFFYSTYGVSYSPLEFGYKAKRVFNSGWMEHFGGQGLYWVLFNLGKVKQWFQYNNSNAFLGVFCYVDCDFVIYFYLLLK
jgi:hypothetical protein